MTSGSSKKIALQKLNTEWEVKDLPLKAGATQAVPGSGYADADIVFVGEGPGKNEDLKGEPFVGAAGKLLDELMQSIGLTREIVFIANTVKHRPPNNRDPLPEELEAYAPWLDKQIDIIKPKLIVTLGRFSMAHFLGPGLSISQVHGQPKKNKKNQIVIPMYHPAAALYNGGLRPTLFEDFARISAVLKKVETETATV